MEDLFIGVIIALGLAAAFLLLRLISIRRSLKEISTDFSEKVGRDSNNVITVSSSDKGVRELAASLNRELIALRQEHLSLQTGSTRLQQAVTNASHDLRTPLTAIVGYLELLEEEQLDETPARYIEIIRERTEALKSLTEELFQYSVVSSCSDELNMKKLSLNDQLEQALAGAYQPLVSRGISPEIHFPGLVVFRLLDENAFQRILGNILSNAAKYSDGDLSVTLDENGVITFSNSAAGLSEVEVGRLFDRFYTVENARGSTGLGLSIAKLLTERMGGSISAEYREGRLSICLYFPEEAPW